MNPLARTEGPRVAETPEGLIAGNEGSDQEGRLHPTVALAVLCRRIRMRRIGAAAAAALILVLPAMTGPPMYPFPKPANAPRQQPARQPPAQPQPVHKPTTPPRAQPKAPQPPSGQTGSQYDIPPTPRSGSPISRPRV